MKRNLYRILHSIKNEFNDTPEGAGEGLILTKVDEMEEAN
jgi:hypothetical protein